MKVRMYNVGCGDCFCLKDRKGSLLVDFGTSNNRIDGHPRSDIFDIIISDFTTISHKSLLLTNFHLDHISGLLYMLKKYKGSNDFNTIYLPDVFTDPSMSRTLTLLLLSDLLKNTYLPSRQISLYAFVEALLKQPQNIEFLKRGDVFEGKYQALWPDCNVIKEETDAVFKHIQSLKRLPVKEIKNETKIQCNKKSESENGINNSHELLRDTSTEMEKTDIDEQKEVAANGTCEEALAMLESFAQKLRQIVCGTLKTNAFALECEFRDLRERPEIMEMIHALEQSDINLRQFKNKLSLVFQSKTDGEMNVLFTGDIPQKYMNMIAANYDDNLPLYEHYWCVKVPNHGIQADYFDFTDYTPENMLISNGIYYADNKKQTKAYRTSAQYAGLFYINDTHMYCSSSACCDGYRNGCTCKECDVISPQYYKDI